MQVVDRTQVNNTINIIPRNYTPTGAAIFKIVIKNEGQNTQVHSATVTGLTAVRYYYTYSANLGLQIQLQAQYFLGIKYSELTSL